MSQPLVEFNDAGLKEEVLRNMVRVAGGRYYTVGEAGLVPEEVAKALRTARVAGMEPERKAIWDTPALFGVLLLIGGLEWGLRRRVGLA